MQCMLVRLIRKVAAQRGLPVIDCNTPFLNGPEFFPASVHATPGSPAADTLTQVIYRALTGSTATQLRPQINQVTSLAYGNSRFAAVENAGTISTSPDGKIWTKQYSDSTYPLHGVASGNNQFVAVGWNGRILSSSDGSSWTARTSGTRASLYSVCYGNGQFVAVGDAILTSSNGTTWTAGVWPGSIAWPASSYLLSVTYGNGQFVAVGSAGQIVTSQNGTSWTLANFTAPGWLTSVIYSNNQFVAVGQDWTYNNYAGTILTSSNGTDWVKRTSVPKWGLWSVSYGNNEYVAVGSAGTIVTSTDGITWTKLNSGTTRYLSSIAYGNNQFVVGGYGLFLTISGNVVGIASQAGGEKSSLRRIAINTANDGISVLLGDPVVTNQLRVTLFNSAGRRVYSSETRIDGAILKIPAKGLPAGKYFISIMDGNSSLFSSDLVLTR
jgi:hypothetical protein